MLWEFISAVFIGKQLIKEKREHKIPAENWRNQNLYKRDRLNPNISSEQLMNNVRNGKYWLSDQDYLEYQEFEKKKYLPKDKIDKKDCDFVVIGMNTVLKHKIEYAYQRICKSLDKYGKCEITKESHGASNSLNGKIDDAYSKIIQRLEKCYHGEIDVCTKQNNIILLKLQEG